MTILFSQATSPSMSIWGPDVHWEAVSSLSTVFRTTRECLCGDSSLFWARTNMQSWLIHARPKHQFFLPPSARSREPSSGCYGWELMPWCIILRTSLVLQWLVLCASTAGGTGSIPGQGTKIPHAMWCGQKITIINKTQKCFLNLKERNVSSQYSTEIIANILQ